MMAAFEAARGALPPPKRPAGRKDIAVLEINHQNAMRLSLGRGAFATRRGSGLGALEARAFRALTEDVVRTWTAAKGPR